MSNAYIARARRRVEALRYAGSNAEAVARFHGVGAIVGAARLLLAGAQGRMYCMPGDWVVKDHCCIRISILPEDEFWETYEDLVPCVDAGAGI